MKKYQFINAFAIGLPVTLALIGSMFETFLFFAMVATALTGLIQLILGTVFWIQNPKNKLIPFYFAAVVLFFIVLASSFDSELMTFLYAVPVLLAIYLTIILHLPKKEI